MDKPAGKGQRQVNSIIRHPDTTIKPLNQISYSELNHLVALQGHKIE